VPAVALIRCAAHSPKDLVAGAAGAASPRSRAAWHAEGMSHQDAAADIDPACALARGETPGDAEPRVLVAVFDSPVASHLLHFARDCGFGTTLLEPRGEHSVVHARPFADDFVSELDAGRLDDTVDVVVTDHDRPELGEVLRDVLSGSPRWIGVMGSPRHAPPHVPALEQLGVPAETIARVHRPIGLNIGSRSPAEIALATLAGLIADRRDRPGGFAFG
jgi:xanthine dehydrogenase accessory factor